MYIIFDYLPTTKLSYAKQSEYNRYKDYNKEEILELINDYKNKPFIKDYLNEQKKYISSLDNFDKKLMEIYKGQNFLFFTSFLNKLPITDDLIVMDEFYDLYDINPTMFKSKTSLRIIMNDLSKKLNDIILNTPSLPDDIVVYRGTQDPYMMNELVKEGNNYVYNIKSFLSTSMIENVASKYYFLNTYYVNGPPTCCMNIIKLPKGIKAFYMYIGSKYKKSEQELILPIGGKLKLVSYLSSFKKFKTDSSKLTTNKLDTYIWEYMSPPKNYVYKEL